MILERTGDLFSSDCPALGQGVNTLGLMGAGIAVEFRRRWPAMAEAYRQAFYPSFLCRTCPSPRIQPVPTDEPPWHRTSATVVRPPH